MSAHREAPGGPTRTVHCADALQWLDANPLTDGQAILTSLPDSSELRRLPFAAWQQWFVATAERLVRAVPARSAAIFYQTDVLRDGHWIDKGHLVHRGADAAGAQLLWHTIACRAPAGTTTYGRPGYAHLLCFAREQTTDPRLPRIDVLPELGPMTWSRAMGLHAVELAVAWLRDVAAVHTVVDPFCGVGTALAVANRFGLAAIGVDRAAGRVDRARTLSL